MSDTAIGTANVAMLDRRLSDEMRDRAVRRVLWASLATALAPVIVTLALVQPALDRLSFADAMSVLHTELASGRSAGDQLRAVMARGGFPGLARIVRSATAQPEPEPEVTPTAGPLQPAPGASTALARAVSSARFPCAAQAEREPGACAIERVRLRPDGPRLLLIDLPRDAGASARGGADETARGIDLKSVAWEDLGGAAFVTEIGPASFTLAGAIGFDEGLFALRPAAGTGLPGAPLADGDLRRSALSGRADRTFEHGNWRLRPEIDLSATHLALDELRLDVGEAGLFLPKAEDWIVSARPAIALEGEIAAAPGLSLAPSLRAGATWLSQSELFTAAMMLDAPATVAGLQASIAPVDELFADVEAGLGLTASERIELSVRYGGMFGDVFETHTGRLELNLQF